MIQIRKLVYFFAVMTFSFYLIKHTGNLFKKTAVSALYSNTLADADGSDVDSSKKLGNTKATTLSKESHKIAKAQNKEERDELQHIEEKTTQENNAQRHQDILLSEESYHIVYFGDSDGSLPDSNSRIDNDLISNGLAFTADLSSLATIKPGEMVHVSIPYMGEGINEVGIVASNQLTPITSSRNVIVEFYNSGTYMTMFYTEGLIKGDIYSAQGSYVYEHDGSHGYVMPIFEYKRLKNALFID